MPLRGFLLYFDSMNKKVLIIDLSNMIMRALFANTPGPEEKQFDLFKATFFSSFFKTISDNSPNAVICCIDSGSWRKDFYPDYKSSRSAKREQSIVNFDAFFAVWSNLLERIKKVFEKTNIKFIEVPKCEADDLIGVITKYNPEWEITNVSSDRDFFQLFKYPNYHQYDGIKKEFLSTLNPDTDLLVKIITGDRGDDVPSLKKGTGVKTAEKIINNDLQAWLDENNLNEAFQRNTKLVSFEAIPTEYVQAIREKVNKITWTEQPSAKDFSSFVMNSGLSLLSVNQSEYVATILNVK